MDWLTDIFSTVATGGITGVIGSVFTGIMAYKEKGAQRAHEKQMRDLDIQERKAEAEISLKQVEAETEGQIAMGELQAFNTSLSSDQARYATGANEHWAFVIVDVIRGLMRPALTVGLSYALCQVIFDVIEALGGWEVVVAAQGMSIVNDLIQSLIYVTTTAIVWWFGSRAVQKGLTTK